MEDDLQGLIGGLNADVAGLSQQLSALRTKLTAATPAATPAAATRARDGGAPRLSLAPGGVLARPHPYMAKTNTQLATALRRALEAAGGR